MTRRPPPDPSEYVYRTYFEKGVCRPEGVVEGCHCMEPGYVRDQLDRSLQNLGLATVDVYYVHNPETQLGEVSREEFMTRMRAVFEVLEEAVREGKIQMYGTATWNGYRVNSDSQEYLPLAELYGLAGQIGGESHHFRVIQLPYNLGMIEAFRLVNQRGGNRQEVSVLEAIREKQMVAMASASIYQGNLARGLPSAIGEALAGLETDAQRAIQFARSTPGVTTALVGMKQMGHVQENLHLARVPTATREEFGGLFPK